jgi:cytochrome c oxidase subunit 3
MSAVRIFKGKVGPANYKGLEVPGIYWHFVDAMWIVVVTTIYVLGWLNQWAHPGTAQRK